MKRLTTSAAIAALLMLPVAGYSDEPSTLPEDTAICTGGGLVVGAATTSTGIGAVPAAMLVAICAIIVQDVRWHLEGNEHAAYTNECRPIPDTNAFQGNC